MRTQIIAPFALLLFLASPAGWAQQKLSDQPGYVSVEQLDLFPKEDLSVEINLEGALLRMVAAATRGEDPGFAQMISNLKGIQVQVFPLAGVEEKSVRTKIGRAIRLLEDRGWKATVRVREKDEESYIYLKESGDQILGLTVLAFTAGQEAALINIVGKLDPAQLERLGRNLDIPQLQKVPAGGKKPE
jgi:hypothetical protein